MLKDLSLSYQKYTNNEALPNDIGRIIEIHRGSTTILSATEQYTIPLPSHSTTDQLNLAVGDWCKLLPSTQNKPPMIQCLPRKNTLSRKVSGTQLKEQVIASNIDLLCICLSMRGNIRPSVIGRYLFVLSGNYRQLLLLTQKDLCPDSNAKLKQIRCAFPHTEIASICAIQNEISDLCNYFNSGETIALVGPSGVGKSTLLNCLIDSKHQATNRFSSKTNKGRHTTTSRSMHYCKKSKIWIIDTPGIRELGIWNTNQESSVFGIFYELAKECKFSNCTHTVEPHCRIQEALHSGEISLEEYKQFIKLEHEKQQLSKAQTFHFQKYKK